MYEGLDDVRASMARLESRARQMVAETSSHQTQRVVRNARSILHASSAVLTDSAGQPQRPLPETSQAATELFLANTVGFNLQEQQRLLRHIAANRPDVVSVASDAPADKGAAHYGAIDLEVALAQRRARTMKMAVDDVHRRMAEAQKEASELAVSAFAEEQVNSITELLGLQSLQLLSLNGGGSAAAAGSSSALATRASEEREMKMAAFANAVEAAPTSEWPTALPNVGIELQGGDIADPLAALWSTAQGIASQQLSHYAATGSTAAVNDANNKDAACDPAATLVAVQCSRAVLEEKFLLSVFGTVLGAEPLQYDELCRMHPTKLRSVIGKYVASRSSASPTQDMWQEIFVAMRAGCYDAARLIAQEAGKASLAQLIGNIATTPIAMRGGGRGGAASAASAASTSAAVAQLWGDNETRTNVYRCAVLVILNGGNFNAASDEGARQLISVIVERVAATIEDILWIRLCLISEVEGPADALDSTSSSSIAGASSGSGGMRKFQSLRGLQRTILDDQQSILALVSHDRIRFASVLLHVLLPSTAVRLLLDNGPTFVDGVHLAMLFGSTGLLRGHEAEPETDLPRLLRRYATMLLEVPHRNSINGHPSRAIFSYFLKCDCTDAFEAMCQNEVVATKLFGAAGDLQAREGALLHSADPDGALLSAMEGVAQTAVAEGNLRLAVQMLTTLEALSSSSAAASRDPARATRALRSAIQALCTCMAHAVHSTAAAARDVYANADRLFAFIEQKSTTDVPVCEIDAFRSLRAILHIHICASVGDEDSAVATVKSIPFIPTSAPAVETALRRFVEMVGSDEVATAMPATCLLIMRLYQSRFHREITVAQRRAMLDRAHALMLWCRRWPSPPTADIMDTMHTIQQQMAAASS